MRKMATLMQRELGAYFLSPIAYVVAAMFLFTSGMAFGLGTFHGGGEASLRPMLEFWMLLILVFVIPMLTMRLISEEVRSGTIESLMTAPVTETDVVLGKFCGAMAFYVVLLATMLIYPILIAIYGDLDLRLLLCHTLGMLLLGGLFIAVGLFFSTCTKHQAVAGLLTSASLALITFASHALATVVEGWPRTLLQHLSVRSHFSDFVRGVIDLGHVVFFVTTTILFLFLAVKWLEMRRWR